MAFCRCNKNKKQTFVQRLKFFILIAMKFDTFNISKITSLKFLLTGIKQSIYHKLPNILY